MWITKLLSLLMTITIANAVSCSYEDVHKQHLVCYPYLGNIKLKRGDVAQNVEITSVSLKACRINEVTCDAFDGLPSAQHLDLAENKIHELPACVLEGMPQLRSLNLSYNSIIDLTPGIFNKLEKIETVDLRGNKIKTIPYGIFGNIPTLRKIDISRNEILGKDLKSNCFEGSELITYLDLSRNSLVGVPDDLLSEFRNLQFLYLERCFLTEVPVFATSANLKTLKTLVLTTNQITEMSDPTVFKNLDDLELLDLAGNAIESLADNIFSPMRKLKSVVLKSNKLKVIPERLFQNMPKLVNIDLSYNIIKKVEVNMFRHTPAKNLNISGNKLTYLPQNFCSEMINAGGNLKKFLFSNNPWQCACFIEILNDVKSNDIEYNNEHFKGNQAICVSADSFTCNRELSDN